MNAHRSPGYPDHPGFESLFLSPAQAQALLRLVESAPSVRRRAHFFMWLQGHVQVLLPHLLVVCGAYSRHRRQLDFDVFNTVVLPPALMGQLSGAQSPLMAALARHWIEGDGQATVLTMPGAAQAGAGEGWDDLQRMGVGHLAVHGVSRPERRHEIESLFVLAGRGGDSLHNVLQTLDLLIPHLHITYLRMLGLERELTAPAASAPPPVSETRISGVTARERQILHLVREGMSNHEIGGTLAISPLTVKNHVQKILRKLGASNRAQAVAMALQSRLITSNGAEFDRGAPGGFASGIAATDPEQA
jgi:transcriptional regulator EpsA